MNVYRAVELLERAEWVFAKTMPKHPHEYTLSKTWKRSVFEEVVKVIREVGVKERFFGREYTYLYANGYKYWTMGAPIKETILINRAVVRYGNDYDYWAGKYDEVCGTEEMRKENEALKALLAPHISGRVLDIGCGTGLAAELFKGLYDEYLGIDESGKMIERAQEKRIEKAHFLNVPVRHFYKRGWDVIIALYGVMSYLPFWEQRKIYEELRGVRFILMYYKPSYTPKTITGLPRYRCAIPELRAMTFTNYEIRSNVL